MFTPKAASTSAEPLRLVAARLPCLATAAPGGGGNQGRRRADVECLGAVAASPAGVDCLAAAGANGRHVPPQGDRRAGNFLDRFAFAVQGQQQPGDLLLVATAFHDLAEGLGDHCHRQILAGFNGMEGGLEHGGKDLAASRYV